MSNSEERSSKTRQRTVISEVNLDGANRGAEKRESQGGSLHRDNSEVMSLRIQGPEPKSTRTQEAEEPELVCVQTVLPKIAIKEKNEGQVRDTAE